MGEAAAACPMRVLHMVSSFAAGGTERQAVQLARSLQATGRYHVLMGSLDSDGSLGVDLEEAGIEVALFPLTSFHDRNAARQLMHLVRRLRTFDAGVVHTHDYSSNMFGMLAAWLARVPVRIASLRSGLRAPLQRRLERGAFQLANRIVVNAEWLQQQLISRGISAAKVTIIPNSLDPTRVRASAAVSRPERLARLGLPPSTPTALVTLVANMNRPVKDHQTFLRAARRVSAAAADTGFVLAGDGFLRPGLEAFARDIGLAHTVAFVGACDLIGDLLAISQVCVLSSRAEGFPNAILEYMAAGRPVVATAVGGVRELVVEGQTGYLVGPADDVAMAARILDLLRDPARAAAMGAQGRDLVQQRFSPMVQLTRTEALYQRAQPPHAPRRSAGRSR